MHDSARVARMNVERRIIALTRELSTEASNHIRLSINMERESLLLPTLTSTRVTSLLNILVKLFLREFYRKMMVLASTT
jgi:hypothetical protein